MSNRTPLQVPEAVSALLDDLHEKSLAEERPLKESGGGYDQVRAAAKESEDAAIKVINDIMRDKFIAIDKDKALLVYHLVRAKGALNVVEVGTSFGVSTIYLASAVGQNAADAGKKPGEAVVIATEHEPTKAAKAREHWRAAGLSVEPWIELREGDVRDTLTDVPPIDFVLFDIWTPLVLPVLKKLEPKLQPGCILIADNTLSSSIGYRDYFEYIDQSRGTYTTLTLPYDGGFEMTVYKPTG